MNRGLQNVILLLILASNLIIAQNDWVYRSKIKFPEADSNTVRPFMCTLDENNRLWVLSTKATDAKAHNAVWYSDPGDTVFTKFIDYDRNGDSDTLSGNVGATRGIAALNGSIYVSFSVPYPKYKPLTLSGMYRYDNADSNVAFSIVASGSSTNTYGSFNHGIDISQDSIIFAGISFGTTFRVYNFSKNSSLGAYGKYITPFPGAQWNENNQTEPGGLETSGKDLIRDIALVPGVDYNESSSYFYSSRNSYSIDQRTGGIALWQGGVQTKPVDYTPARVIDFNDYLAFIDPIGYGIDVDKNGILWVAGSDSTRRWVKGFALEGINAVAVYDLPSSTSMDIADLDGAPMSFPCDVVVSNDAGMAYVTDMYGECAYVFQNTTVDVKDEISGKFNFELQQNYPNPFNPSTLIKYTLSEQSHVKLIVTDILGREIAVLADEVQNAGNHAVSFKSENLSTGIYFYHLISGGQKLTRKMLLMK